MGLVLWVALGLLIAGLNLTMVRFEQFWIFSDEVSLWSGTIKLLRSGETFLGSVLMAFSIGFPIVKNLWMLVLVHFDRMEGTAVKVLGALGKWSMLDVFVVAILIVSARLSGVTSAEIGPGLYYFVASVLMVNAVSTWLTLRPVMLRQRQTAG